MTTASHDNDKRAAAIARSSLLVHALERLLSVAAAAWSGSVAGTTSARAAAWINGQTVADRVRLAGALAAVASATALALEPFSSRPAPFLWIVPSCCLAIGLVLLLATGRERRTR